VPVRIDVDVADDDPLKEHLELLAFLHPRLRLLDRTGVTLASVAVADDLRQGLRGIEASLRPGTYSVEVTADCQPEATGPLVIEAWAEDDEPGEEIIVPLFLDRTVGTLQPTTRLSPFPGTVAVDATNPDDRHDVARNDTDEGGFLGTPVPATLVRRWPDVHGECREGLVRVEGAAIMAGVRPGEVKNPWPGSYYLVDLAEFGEPE
jgi:hypothetical protein